MADTYTFTARSAENPDKVITFTLYGEYLRINLTDVVDRLGRIATAEERGAEIREQIKSHAQPTTAKFIENVTGPVHLRDVNARFDGERFSLSAWKRALGLRLAPIYFSMGTIDNPDAAQSFVNELERRKESSEHIGKFFGPLDYWMGWAGVVLGITLLLNWPESKGEQEE